MKNKKMIALFISIVIICVCIVGLLGLTLYLLNEDEDSRNNNKEFEQYVLKHEIYNNDIQVVSASPNNDLVAVATGQGITLYDSDSYSSVAFLDTETSHALSIAWSPDSMFVASAGIMGPIEVWSVSNASVVYTIPDFADFIWGLSWSPDGKRLATGSGIVWDIESRNVLYSWVNPTSEFAWSPDGRYLAALVDSYKDGGGAI